MKHYTAPGMSPTTVTDDQLEQLGMVVCPICDRAVVEDELVTCQRCKAGMCLYCWYGPCPEHGVRDD